VILDVRMSSRGNGVTSLPGGGSDVEMVAVFYSFHSKKCFNLDRDC
jgi:hypothetical protein